MTTPGFATPLAATALALLLLAGCTTAAAQEGTAPASDLITIDSHVDIPDAYMREARFDAGTDSVLQADLPSCARAAWTPIFLVVYVEQGPLTEAGYAQAVARAENKYSAIDLLLQKYPNQIRLATSPAQVRANHKAGLLSALIGIENGYALGHDLARLDAISRPRRPLPRPRPCRRQRPVHQFGAGCQARPAGAGEVRPDRIRQAGGPPIQ